MGEGQEVARAVPRQVLHGLKRIRPMFGDGQRVLRQAVIEGQAAGLAARRGREARQGGQQMLAPLGRIRPMTVTVIGGHHALLV